MTRSINRLLTGLLLGATLLAASIGSRTAHAQPSAPLVHLDIQYGEAGGQPLLLDSFTPAAPGNHRPAVIFVHGGGWSGGDKDEFRSFATYITTRGWAAFSVDYRLVTDDGNKFPVQLDDVQRAVRWVRAHAADYGVNPARIAAYGDSAGGHLAALLGTTDTRDNSDPALARYSSRVQCVVDLFGPTDFTLPMGSVGPQATQLVLNLMGVTPDRAPKLYREASPITHIDRRTVPFLIFHGEADSLVPIDQSQRFYRALRKAGIEAKLVTFPYEGHGFTRPEDQQTVYRDSMEFLTRHLGMG